MVRRKTKYLISAVLCILSFEVACQAADYYVDTAGNDGNSGVSTSSPWKTVSKVNSFAFNPGDRVFFRRGQTWREQLSIKRSGTAGNPIVFGAYGSGDRPVIKGSNLIGGWSSAGSNRWTASCSTAPNQVFFNGARGTKRTGQSSVTAARHWYWSSGTLTVYSTSTPSNIEASVRPNPRGSGTVHIQGCQYVVVEGLAVLQSASFGLYLRSPGSYITIRDCEVADAQDGGLVAPSQSPILTQITFENCMVHHNNGGIFEGDAGNTTWHEGLTVENVDGFLVRGCHVYDNYIEGSNFKRGARNGIIENCTLYRNARINQYLEGATNIQIRYNKIYSATYNAGIEFGIETSDRHNDNVRIYNNLFWGNAGGISFWSGGSAQTRNVNIYNNTFYNNWEAIRWKSGAANSYSGTNYIRNNIIWQNGSSNRAIWDYNNNQAINRTTISHNVFQSGGATHTTGSNATVVSSINFANPSANDFHLLSGSPAIDKGTNLGVTRDFDGNDVFQGDAPECGAYEYCTVAPTYVLTVNAAHGSVARTPDNSSYDPGQTVTLHAIPSSGYTFNAWSGDLTGTINPATLVMDSHKLVTANFTADIYTLAISASNGSVARTPSKPGYIYGDVVTLQATPNSGYTFTGWSGDITGTTNPATLVMNASKSVTASFTANAYTLTVSAANGSVTRTPDKTSYAHGEVVTLAAAPAAGYAFSGWSGDASGANPSTTVTMTSHKSVTASFTSTGADTAPPVLADCSPVADSIQAPVNTLVAVTLRDESQGIDPSSVSIRVNGDLVYTGDASTCRTAYGDCRRSGTNTSYTYTYQQHETFSYGTKVDVAVNARDMAGNAMPEQTYSFATEMYAFGLSQEIVSDTTRVDQTRPATLSDDIGDIWVAWQSGLAGERQVCVSRFSPDTRTYGSTTQVSQGKGDHCNPAIAADHTGTLYVVWQENTRGAWDVCLSTSDRGGAWSAPRRIVDSNDNQVNPAIAAGKQSSSLAAIAWQDDRAGNQDIYAAISTNRFQTMTVSRITSNAANQTDPAVTIDCEDTILALWTDARNSSTDIYGAASNGGLWTNVPVVNTTTNQSHPAVASGSATSALHVTWIDDARGDRDVCYATSDGLPASPVAGVSIIDDTSGADQQAPVIAVAASANGPDKVFVCWIDERNVISSGDTDLYFADVSPGSLRTNVLVDDRGTNSNPMSVAMGIDRHRYPYVVWSDDAGERESLCHSGVTYMDPAPLTKKEIVASSGGIVGTPTDQIRTEEDVSVAIPGQACPANVTISITRIRNPQGFDTEPLRTYDFGPSGLTFSTPATVTIPYGVQTAGRVRAYWYNSATGTFSDQGVTDVEEIVTSAGLRALRFRTTHFTPFYLVAAETSDPSSGGSGGGGCSLAGHSEGDILGYFAPYLIVVAAVLLWRRRDARA